MTVSQFKTYLRNLEHDDAAAFIRRLRSMLDSRDVSASTKVDICRLLLGVAYGEPRKIEH